MALSLKTKKLMTLVILPCVMFSTVPIKHCYGCNNDIPENEMNNHQQLCVPPMRPVESIESRVSSIRRKRSNDENLNVYIDNDQKPHGSKLPRTPEPKRSTRYLTGSEYSNEGYQNDTIEDNQGSSPIRPYPAAPSEVSVNYPLCKYCDEGHPQGIMEEHQTLHCPNRPHPAVTKTERKSSDAGSDNDKQQVMNMETTDQQRPSPVRATPPLDDEPLRLSPCCYCQKEYLDSEIKNHRKSCPARPQTAIPQRPCNYCEGQYSLAEIEHHEKTCRSRLRTDSPPSSPPPNPVSRPRPKSAPSRQCIYCSQQHPLTAISAHENSCSLKPKSCTERLFSWMCCCCAND